MSDPWASVGRPGGWEWPTECSASCTYSYFFNQFVRVGTQPEYWVKVFTRQPSAHAGALSNVLIINWKRFTSTVYGFYAKERGDDPRDHELARPPSQIVLSRRDA